MKTKLLIVALLCFSGTAFSQTLPQTTTMAAPQEPEEWVKPKPLFGIIGGVNLATIRPLFNDEPKISLHAGLFREQRLSKDFGYQLELNFSKQGCSIASEYQEFRLNYLQLPVLLNVYGSDRILIQGGGYGAYLLSASVDQKFTTSQTYQFAGSKTDVYDYFESFDAGVCLGLTFSSSNRTQIGVRYNYGLANINQQIQFRDTKEFPHLNNSVVQFSAGFRF